MRVEESDIDRSGSRQITMADVARIAGVHQATVSRVLNRPDAVRTETRERVEAVIQSLSYVPHAGARQMAGGRTGVVAAFVPDLANPYFAGLLKSLQRAGAVGGCRLMVADTDFDADTETELIRTFVPSVDAVIVCSPVGATARLRSVAGDRPLVFVNRSASSVSSVTVDQVEIVRAGVAHLRTLGHRRLGLVLGPDEYWSSAQRRGAVADSDDVVVFDHLRPTFDGGVEALEAVTDAGVTGVLAFNDLMALGILSAAAARGVSVPDDLSVVGSDDIPIAAMANPPLTTLVAPLDLLGSVAMELVQDALGGSTKPSSRTLPVELVERATTSAPARAGARR